jgi:hypothetical protein
LAWRSPPRSDLCRPLVLPDPATVLAVLAINLDNRDLVIMEETGKTDTPRTGALNTHDLNLTLGC